MKNTIGILLLCFVAATTTVQAQDEINTMFDENGNIVHEQFRSGNSNVQSEEDYMKSLAFQRQIGITQVSTGSVLLPSGLVMIGAGVYKFNNTPSGDSPEGVVPDKIRVRAGTVLTVTGALSSVAGAILIMKGVDTLKQVKNRKGEVVGEIGLPTSGIVGMSLRF